jgi:Uma2 family endonuclease
MASALAPTIAPDTVLTFDINPGTLLQFLELRAEGGPRLKCLEGSVTLVSPGMAHESTGQRFASLVLAICLELRIKHSSLASTTWTLPAGAEDTGYEADCAYYIQSYGRAKLGQPPDLAIEVVLTHPEKKALLAGALLKIPEMWVYHLHRHRLTFHHLVSRGKRKGTYRIAARSRAFPGLTSSDVLERLDDPEMDGTAFHENCRAWARDFLVPRVRAEGGGA